MTSTLAPVLSIAGSDSSGGAGIQADLKTMLANGVFGMTAIAALTAQNTTGVTMVTNTPPEMLAAQIDAVFEDIPPVAVKIGMVSATDIIDVIAERLTFHHATNIVLDPVMVATSGANLISDDAIAALTGKLFPMATVVTPNIPEAEVLTDTLIRVTERVAEVRRAYQPDFPLPTFAEIRRVVQDEWDEDMGKIDPDNASPTADSIGRATADADQEQKNEDAS